MVFGTPSDACLLIPCLDEARVLGTFLEECRSALTADRRSWSIIVADNDSADHSAAIAHDAGVRVLHVPRRGYGIAIDAGIRHSQAPWVVVADADATYDPRDAITLVDVAEARHADLVLGSRLRGRIEPGAMPTLHRYVGTPVLSSLIRHLYGAPITDCNCGLRVVRRDVYATWNVDARGMEFASAMVIDAALAGARIEEHPVALRRSPVDRQPHLRPWRDGLRHLRVIARRAPEAFYAALSTRVGATRRG